MCSSIWSVTPDALVYDAIEKMSAKQVGALLVLWEGKLTGIISEHPKLAEEEKSKRALQTLLHPEMLGRAFQVLTLNKDVDPAKPLAGFKFARDAQAELGI